MELHKTGCSHIRNTLQEVLGGEFIGKHNQASDDLLNNRRIVGSVRDPWGWYLSLWAYGCDSRGALYANVTRDFKNATGLGWRHNPYQALLKLLTTRSNHSKAWKLTYADVEDAAAFREWLYLMHDSETMQDIREGYGGGLISSIAGLMTYRYLNLFCTKLNESKELLKISSMHELLEYEKNRCFIDFFIRNESLESGLLRLFDELGLSVSDEQQIDLHKKPRTNTSSRRKDRAFYYDESTVELVRQRESLIVNKFNYDFDIP